MNDIDSAPFTGAQESVADGADVITGEHEPIEDPRVLAAIERLADLEGLPIAEQVDVFADVHARLTEALGTETEHTFETPVSEANPEAGSGQAAFGDMTS